MARSKSKLLAIKDPEGRPLLTEQALAWVKENARSLNELMRFLNWAWTAHETPGWKALAEALDSCTRCRHGGKYAFLGKLLQEVALRMTPTGPKVVEPVNHRTLPHKGWCFLAGYITREGLFVPQKGFKENPWAWINKFYVSRGAEPHSWSPFRMQCWHWISRGGYYQWKLNQGSGLSG